MAVVKGRKLFLPCDDDRLLLILTLTILYPVFVSFFFLLFLFWILPVMLAPVNTPGFWLYGYWLLVAGIWLLLLAIILPLMGPGQEQSRAASYKRESGVSMKDDAEMRPLNENNAKPVNGASDNYDGKLVAVTTALTTYQMSSDSTDSVKSVGDESSHDKLVPADSHDAMTVSNQRSASQYGLDVQSVGSFKRSSLSLSERQKLTQSGEFLNDCIGSLKSEDDIQGEIIRGNTNCQVHVEADDRSSDGDSSKDALLDSKKKNSSDTDSCKELPHERVDRSSIYKPSHYAAIEKTEVLAQKESAEPVNEAINEAIDKADRSASDVQQRPQDGTTEENGVEDECADEMEPMLRTKAKAAPSKLAPLNTVRASQVECSAPSSMSPRKSNIVFIYVNADQECAR